MNLEQTMTEAKRLDLSFGVTEDFRLSIQPKARITPELRTALTDHKGEIACELLWSRYAGLTGADQDIFPPAGPAMREAYGNPRAFAKALVEFDLARKYWDLIKRQAESPRPALIITEDGIIALQERPDGGREAAE
jgi:hypothetical protein